MSDNPAHEFRAAHFARPVDSAWIAVHLPSPFPTADGSGWTPTPILAGDMGDIPRIQLDGWGAEEEDVD